MVFWTFSRAIFVCLQHCNGNNTSDKQRNKFFCAKKVQKTKFEAAEMILDPGTNKLGIYVFYSKDISFKKITDNHLCCHCSW